ncbi:MAG TPA: hypothetical protein PLM25_04630 [Limnochordia bacterium]|nr:hypothetical protein [Limnochordia bacterium]
MRCTKAVSGLVLLVILSCGAGVLASSPFAARSNEGGWASEALRALAEPREIPGFSVPEQPNRSQEALLVARLLQHISGEDRLDSRRFGVSRSVYLDDLIFTYNQRVSPEKQFSASEVETLYRLVLEFRDELEVLGFDIQDFDLLYAQNWAQKRGLSLAARPLLYSEQALAAARKAEEAAVVFEPEAGAVLEPVTAAQEGRSLWTGQFSPTGRLLPSALSFVAQEPVQERSAIQIGGLELSGELRAAVPEGPNADVAAGYGLSVKMGDVSLQTAVDLAVDPHLVPKTASTSVDLSWDWANMFTLSAGYKLRERLQSGSADEEEEAPLVTSLGVTVPMERGQVRLGINQEWNFSSLGGLAPGSGESMTTRNVAELGLSYELFNDSSLHFNYRLIDFSSMERDLGAEAEAAFSIKF